MGNRLKWEDIIGGNEIKPGDEVLIEKEGDNIRVTKLSPIKGTQPGGCHIPSITNDIADGVREVSPRVSYEFRDEKCNYPGDDFSTESKWRKGIQVPLENGEFTRPLIEDLESIGINPGSLVGRIKEIPGKDRFEMIGREIGELVSQKNEAYGDAFAKCGQILQVLYPDGIKPEQYVDVLATVRILDKLFRIATRKDAFGESPYKDIAGYGILGVANDEKKSS